MAGMAPGARAALLVASTLLIACVQAAIPGEWEFES